MQRATCVTIVIDNLHRSIQHTLANVKATKSIVLWTSRLVRLVSSKFNMTRNWSINLLQEQSPVASTSAT